MMFLIHKENITLPAFKSGIEEHWCTKSYQYRLGVVYEGSDPLYTMMRTLLKTYTNDI